MVHDGNSDPAKRQPRYCFGASRFWDFEKVPGDTLRISIDEVMDATGHSATRYRVSSVQGATGGGGGGPRNMMLGPHATVDAITYKVSQRHVFHQDVADQWTVWAWFVEITLNQIKLTEA